MKNFNALIILVLVLVTGRTQAQPEASVFVVDTLMIAEDTILVYSDKTWEYLEVVNFDGVMNHELHQLVTTDTNYNYIQDWNNEMPYTYDNNLAALNDTLWLCNVDSAHPNWSIPFDGPVISTFKYRGRRFHYGIDIDLDTGDSVRAAFDGRVRYAMYNKSGFGNLVIIRHHNGLETYYAHFSKLLVTPNQDVKAGQVIGLGGSTGRSTGPHLHFEVRLYHNALNPEEIFDFKQKTLKDENLLVHKDFFDYKKVSRSSSSRTSSSTATASSDVKYHKVRKGDSLYKIGRTYGTSIDRLCELNNISRESILNVGQVLKVR